jgi:WD40 repeat protein
MAAYIPESNRIVVSNEGDGTCKIFDATTYKLVDTVKFADDADQLRYDPATKRVYVGYGDGAIGMFDATTNKKLDGDFELGAHPESFQLEEKGPRIFVNLASSARLPSLTAIHAKSRNGSSKRQEQTSRWHSMKNVIACLLPLGDPRACWYWIRTQAK